MASSGTQTGEKLICQRFPFWIKKKSISFLCNAMNHTWNVMQGEVFMVKNFKSVSETKHQLPYGHATQSVGLVPGCRVSDTNVPMLHLLQSTCPNSS